MTPRVIGQRIFLFQFIILLGFGILSLQLWRIQIVGDADLELRSKENRVGFEDIEAPRGVIYDRKGRILVRNRLRFRATFLAAEILNQTWLLWEDEEWEQAATTLGLIAQNLQIPFVYQNPAEALKEAFDEASGQMLIENIGKLCQEGLLFECYAEALVTAPYKEITIQKDFPTEVAFTLMENSINLPGVSVVSESQRQYLYGELYAHLIGYELPISEQRLNRQTRFTTNPYLASDRVGTAGVEAGFEDQLRGIRGLRSVEKNVMGQQIRMLHEEPAMPGNNLFLTIDTELQKVVTEALQEGMREVNSKEGVAIVMNTNTGEILAMVSLPSYDNNVFVDDLNSKKLSKLFEDPRKPIFNRAISGAYPPGSIFKIIPAVAGLAEGAITRETAIYDPGQISIGPQNFVCWLDEGHGDQNVVEALAHSCDVFFYEVVGGYLDEFEGIGADALAKWGKAFGLGLPTHIDLPGEALGHMPTPQWKRLTHQESWSIGDSYNMSIGQGFVLVTPLQILNATIAVANGGTVYKPQIVYQVQNSTGEVMQSFEPKVLREVDLPPEIIKIAAEGMHGTIAMDDGTASWRFRESPVDAAGKTGTAEYCPVIKNDDGTYECLLDEEGYQLTHSWFTAFAPYENPEIALVVFVHGNNKTVIQGSEVSAPIARRIMDYYFGTPALEPIDPPSLTNPSVTSPQSESSESATSPQSESPNVVVRSGDYIGTLIRFDSQGTNMDFVLGQVVDKVGNPIPDVAITIYAKDKAVASVMSGADGKFRYNLLDPKKSKTWTIRAPYLPGDPKLELEIEPQQFYTILFQQNP
ncbi:MAG: penicillin-binding protein 2 [Ardenticatenaceae bacterium]